MISNVNIPLLGLVLMAGCSTMPEETPNFDRGEFRQEIATHDPEAVARIERAQTRELNQYLIPEHTPLDIAVAHSNDTVAKLLIDKGVDVNRGTPDGSTPLHTATQWNKHEMVRLLLDAGANPNKKNQRGETPLDLAFYENSRAAGAVLKEFGATFSKVLKERHNEDDAAAWLKSL